MDGADIPVFNELPAIKTTLEMIDGVEATAQRGRDTLILEHEGMEIFAHTTGKMFVIQEECLKLPPTAMFLENLPPK